MLTAAIKSKALDRHSAAVTNFDMRLPEPRVQLAKDTLIDPYIFDFLTLDKPFRERELEAGLVEHLERFLLELGAGFAFVGRQVHLDVAEEDFYSNEYITEKIQFMDATASITEIDSFGQKGQTEI
jgi:predicted nuclease of restriction endonuclease-like (RecB) superfamily